MKHIHKMGGAALLVLLLTAHSSFAQTTTTRYVDPAGGKTEVSTCTSPDPANVNGPCTIERVYAAASSGDTFLIQVPQADGTVTLTSPTSQLAFPITFGVYAEGKAGAVKGTIRFRRQFTIGTPDGQFKPHEKVMVEFGHLEVAGGRSARAEDHYVFAGENKPWERVSITEYLELSSASARFDRLVVSESFTLIDKQPLVLYNGLTVKRGATLTLQENLFFRAGKKVDPAGVLQVDGAIEGTTLPTHANVKYHIIFGYHPGSRRGDGTDFILTSEYKPADGVDHNDCFRIRGSGRIDAAIRTVGNGNICVEMKHVGNIHVGGSIVEGTDERQNLNITTDLIFRNEVVIDGDLIQHNDARVVFEKTATIKGDVILADQPGLFPFDSDLLADSYGTSRGTSVRQGVQNGDSGDFTCAYVTNRKDNKMRGAHIPGVQFEDEVRIEGDLQVHSKTLEETTSNSAQASTECAPRVLFMVPPAKKTGAALITKTSHIGGKLFIEGAEDFNDKGRVYLDYDSLKTGKVITHESIHSLHVGGGIAARGMTLGIGNSKTVSNAGMCGATKVTRGNELLLTGTGTNVLNGALTLDALFVQSPLEIQNGPLTVKHLHVQPGGELKANGDVVVSETLILEGDGLSGKVSDNSTIKTLVYGSPDTDVVQSAALADTLGAFTIEAGTGEVGLDQVTRAKNIGLCSGTLILREAGTAKDSTLVVYDQITVQNGKIQKDTNSKGSLATDKNRYLLKYITPGKLEAGDALEWFNPQDVTVDHEDAEIMVDGARSLMGTLTVENGKLVVDGMVTAGNVTLSNASTLETKEDKVVVNGKVMMGGTSQFLTAGGDLQVSGQVSSGRYTNNTAQVTVAKGTTINLGTGTLLLGPEDTRKRTGLTAAARPDVLLKLDGEFMGMISVPKGSKETTIHVATISGESKELETITFDGTPTPGDKNDAGLLKITSVDTEGKILVIDSLSAMQGSVETRGSHVKFTRDVHLSSGDISPYGETTTFMGSLKLSGTGGLSTEKVDDDTLSVAIHGDFMQTEGKTGSGAGVSLHAKTTKTVKGDFVVSADPAPYKTKAMSTLIVEGDFQYMKDTLHAKVEFKATEAQEVKTGTKTQLHSVVVNNANGLKLTSSVTQQNASTLTLRRGRITNADTTKAYTWTLRNPQIEENLQGRTSALETKKCGADEDEACKFSISRGSRQSHALVPFTRHLEHGNSGEGAMSGGYLFPVGVATENGFDYRPLILQLPFDLPEADSATVSPIMVPTGAMPEWENISAPISGGESLTLDVHADLFWKIQMDEALESEVNIRVVAAGIPNVSNPKRLRLVQWNCDWENPKLAGRYSATIAAGSFGVNDMLNGVVNLTQERITLEACTILGIAANGVENPIDQAELTGGRARLQFIHNVPGVPVPVDVYLGDLRIRSGMEFQSATAYRTVGAGDYELTIQADGLPEDDAPDPVSLTLGNDRNYVVIAHGSTEDTRMKVLETRLESRVTNKVDAILVHGAPDLGVADVQVLDASDNRTLLLMLANNIPFDGKTSYLSLTPSMHNVQVSSSANGEEFAVFQMDLNGYAGQTLVLNLSGSKSDLKILGVDKNGAFLPDVITGVETEDVELPTEFALHGNYPNPFNPSTRIQFDLPETAQVRVQIVDMLGREVMSLPAQEFEAGANRSVEIHAMNLASGTYLYRMIATGAENRHVKTGRMTLVK